MTTQPDSSKIYYDQAITKIEEAFLHSKLAAELIINIRDVKLREAAVKYAESKVNELITDERYK